MMAVTLLLTALWGQSPPTACEIVVARYGEVPVMRELPSTADLVCENLLAILNAYDANTGAITRVVYTDADPADGRTAMPGTAVQVAREAAWYLLALDQCGLHEIASQAAGFLAAGIRSEDSDFGPRGSVSALRRSAGDAASPYYVWDIAASAYVLAGLRSHVGFLEETDRDAQLRTHRDAIGAAADLLANWTLGGSGEIAPAYVPAFGHDGVTAAMYFEFWMGLEAARQCLEYLGEAVPAHWLNRQRELMSRIKFQRINRGAPARLSWNLGQWFQRISRWDNGELGLYLANEAGVIAPGGFGWDLPALMRAARAEPDPPDPLEAAIRTVAIIEYQRLTRALPTITRP